MQFKQIIGQDKIKRKLLQSVEANRVSHTQLFVGPSGSGKLALAIAFAQYINCENKKEIDNDVCGTCPSCIKFNKLIHPDLHFIFPVASTPKNDKPKSADFLKEWRSYLHESDFYPNLNEWYIKSGIENKQAIINARDCEYMLSKLGLKAFEGRNKFVIIWMVEKLFHAAAPKLLKILEEPPENTYIFLVSENPDMIISTILSRCLMVKIPTIDNVAFVSALQNNFDLPSTELYRIANQTKGNYNHALTLISKHEEQYFYNEKFINWMRSCYSLNISELVLLINELSKIGRERQKILLNHGLSVIRNAMHINHLHIDLEKYKPEEGNFLQKFSQFITPDNISEISKEFNKALFHIERNGNAAIILMDLSLSMNQLLRKTVAV